MAAIDFTATRDWLFDSALPLWAAHGVDRVNGGFFEKLDAAGAPVTGSYKRVRTMCRQTYVFSHAAVLGWSPGAELARWGYDYLCARVRLSEGRWAKTLTHEGGVENDRIDLYDLAFVIFAMAWYFRATRDESARRHAKETLSFIQSRLGAPNGGFLHVYPVSGPRLQNPHMHLAEACLAAFEALKEDEFLVVARDLVGLLKGKFFDGLTLGERFDDAWRRLGGETELEPGHHFEWVWILSQFSRIAGEDIAALARGLLSFAERAGVNPRTGAVYDAIAADGEVVRASSRIWPTTERIKAAVGMFELTGEDPRSIVSNSLQVIQQRHFNGAKPGLWIDQIDSEGRPLTQIVPASCLYHIFLAFSEILRVRPAIVSLQG